jgi:hypothetical protein
MTDDKIALRQMLEKGSDATFLREMIGFAAQRLMELEVGEVTGAAHGEHAPAGARCAGRQAQGAQAGYAAWGHRRLPCLIPKRPGTRIGRP